MKVILRADMDNLGRLGDVVSVKPGYGRNFLIPKGLAMPASDANVKVFELERKKLQQQMDELRTDAQGIADRISRVELTIPVRVGDSEKLYGSVTKATVGEALDEQGIEIDRRKIMLDAPIRMLGEYMVPIKLHPDVECELKVNVVREDGLGVDMEPELSTREPEPETEGGEPEAESQSEQES